MFLLSKTWHYFNLMDDLLLVAREIISPIELDVDIEKVIKEGLTYSKIHTSLKKVNKKILMELLT